MLQDTVTGAVGGIYPAKEFNGDLKDGLSNVCVNVFGGQCYFEYPTAKVDSLPSAGAPVTFTVSVESFISKGRLNWKGKAILDFKTS